MSKKKEVENISALKIVMTVWAEGDEYPRRTEINLDRLLNLIMNKLDIRVQYHNEQSAYYSIEKKEKKK